MIADMYIKLKQTLVWSLTCFNGEQTMRFQLLSSNHSMHSSISSIKVEENSVMWSKLKQRAEKKRQKSKAYWQS